ncbi:MAG: glycosyltransferase [Gammaproteobacteria bacterium]
MSNPMHLVDTTLFFSPTSGGVRRYLMAKHAWLRANSGWKHSILVPGDVEHVEQGGISSVPGILWPGAFNYRLPLNPRRWSRLLDQLEPDFIEAGDAFHPAWCAWRVGQRRNIPLAAFYHSNMPQIIARRIGAVTERVLARYVRWLYERFDVVFAPSRLMCAFLNDLGVHHTMHQPLGVDAEVFAPERRTLDLRAKLGLPPETRLLAYAGRFSGEKNVNVLLQAFARLGKPYHLLLIGGDKTARPNSNVTMLPYRADSYELAQWLASADALVHAGTKETFGLVILEAMACGRPVVAARAGAIPEIVDESVGMLAKPSDGESMAEAIAALYERDIEAVGAAARARVLKQFTWTQSFTAQVNAYNSLVGARRVHEVPARGVIELGSPTS